MADLVAAENLSEAWLAALELLVDRDGRSVNLLVSFADSTAEVSGIRAALDDLLAERRVRSVQTVANTIFPMELYRPQLGSDARPHLYDMYQKAMELHRRRSPTDRDTYFNRLVTYPGPNGPVNQLDYVIERLRKQLSITAAASSAYEVGLSAPSGDSPENRMAEEMRIQAPGKDRRLRGFPCLSHISLTLERPRLHLTATYRNQSYIERAYGNLLGLARLQTFLCGESGCQPGEVLCVATHASAEIETYGKRRVRALAENARATLSSPRQKIIERV